MSPDIYLDIDGVLITKRGTPAKAVTEFLRYVTFEHDVYWLTTHCNGDPTPTQRYLSRFLPQARPYYEKVLPTRWQTLKTNAIDFSEDFLWLDDYVMDAERQLVLHAARGRVVPGPQKNRKGRA